MEFTDTLSDCQRFPAQQKQHRAGAQGKKGKRGRRRNRNVADLKQIDLGGRTNVDATRWIQRNRLRTGAICHKCADNVLSGAGVTKSLS